MLNLLGHGLVILLLTAVTQIGGLAYLLALILRRLAFRGERGRGVVSRIFCKLIMAAGFRRAGRGATA